MTRLANKTALITGAAQGIGAAIAKLFIAEGARVVLTDINRTLGQQLADQLGEMAEFRYLDVSDESNWQSISASIEEKYGVLDVLVNNAGITGFFTDKGLDGPHDPEHLDLDSWRYVQQVNLDSVALGCKYGIGLMKKSSGASIVNISSRSGLVGIPGASSYAASKAGVRNHSKSVALYCAEQGYEIRCNSIHPGAILTPMWDAMLGQGEQREAAITAVANDVPLKVMGEPDDVAYAALYLASNESKYVTGIELNIDGGILAGSSAAPKTDD